jgi:hypothetical protein
MVLLEKLSGKLSEWASNGSLHGDVAEQWVALELFDQGGKSPERRNVWIVDLGQVAAEHDL